MTLTTQLTTRDPASARLRCGLCAQRCLLPEGQVGRCGAILHHNDQLHALAAGRPVVLHADPIERKPLYHVFPGSSVLSLGTMGCTMSCSFCQNWRIAHARPDPEEPIIPITLEHAALSRTRKPIGTSCSAICNRQSTIVNGITPPEAIIRATLDQGCNGIAFTYNEPTIYLDYAAEIIQLAQAAEFFCIFKSNGYMTIEALELLPRFAAINIDLKSFSDSFYRRICGARLQPVLEVIEYLQRRGIWLEVTTLLIPRLNDSDEELRALTNWLAALSPEIPWHVWRFHPDYQLTHVPWTHVNAVERAISIGRAAGLRYVYASNIPGDPNQHTRCPTCGTPLIERIGNSTTSIRLNGDRCTACGWTLPGRFG
ncbi:radical SAM protein [Candidatus Viridilinea mediisalina]|uniref:Radical SAM core domain-containing protein n=1 Tax=Candidatus Viridilinea mediisalina TaxID=2024553 RepID=A0A2A6REV0_9CHLR|nr:radical SAM protein [Candidatus Viridilinea mediisalina]PDW01542.1 hypothetical protein CJ255_18560 [Candidatus Viridilinea mediisalina]